MPGVNDRRQALWEVGLRYQASGSQGRLQLEVMQDMATLRPALDRDRMTYEYETLGLWTDGHVMSTMREFLTDHQVLNSTQLDDKSDEEHVIVAGKVLRRQRPLGKMVFMTLEDEFGMIPLAIPPDTWAKYRDQLRMPVIVAEGQMSRKNDTMNIMVRQAWPLTPTYTPRADHPRHQPQLQVNQHPSTTGAIPEKAGASADGTSIQRGSGELGTRREIAAFPAVYQATGVSKQRHVVPARRAGVTTRF